MGQGSRNKVQRLGLGEMVEWGEVTFLGADLRTERPLPRMGPGLVRMVLA